MAHTPGPWHVEDDGEDIFVIGRPEWKCTRNGVEGQWDVASITDLYEDNKPEMLANARLIAAAPDLLVALKLAKDHSELEDEILEIVDAALSKATS